MFFAKLRTLSHSCHDRCCRMTTSVMAESLGIRQKEVGVEGLADAEEEMGVNGGFVVNTLQSARSDTDAVSKPFVGMALAAEFVADKVAYVYLHIAICFCGRTRGYASTVSLLPIP